MKPFDFLPPNDNRLNFNAEKISLEELALPSTQTTIQEMLRFAMGEQGDLQKRVLVGLAAPQIGILKRIIIVDSQANGKGITGSLKAYINPEITWSSSQMERWYEGCFSTASVAGIVSRPREIIVEALDIEGNRIVERHSGYVARIFQHEIDHLNGIRFPMRILNPDDLHWVEKQEFPHYRNLEQWRHWECKCSWNQWLEMIQPNFL